MFLASQMAPIIFQIKCKTSFSLDFRNLTPSFEKNQCSISKVKTGTLASRAQWPSKSMFSFFGRSKRGKMSSWSDRVHCQHGKYVYCVFHEGHLSLWRFLLWPVSFLRRTVCCFTYFRRSCDSYIKFVWQNSKQFIQGVLWVCCVCCEGFVGCVCACV